MWYNRVVLSVIILLFAFVGFPKAYKYKSVIQNDEIFDDCPDQPKGALNVHGLFNLSELIFHSDLEKVFVSGNATLVWDIQPMDRIQGQMQLFHFDRGSWQPTIFTITVPSFCHVMYDPNQYWYKAWLQYVINAEAIKNKCFNVPGTKFIHKPFEMEFIFESHLSNMNGQYKARVTLVAFNLLNIRRPTFICLEIREELFRL